MILPYRSARRIAELISERLAARLDAIVSIVDQRDVVIASNQPGTVGFPLDEPAGAAGHSFRVPLPLEDEQWQVVVRTRDDTSDVTRILAEEWLALLLTPAHGSQAWPSAAELRDAFVLDLLHGRLTDEAEARRLGHVLGFKLTWPCAVLLIDARPFILGAGADPGAGAPAHSRRRADVLVNIVRTNLALHDDPICAYIGEGEVAALVDWIGAEEPPDAPFWTSVAALKQVAQGLRHRLAYETQGQATIGLGRYHPGLAGLARSARDARAALTLGLSLTGPNAVYCLDTLGIAALAFVTDEETKLDLARQLLHPLAGEPELRQTLDAFFAANCSPSLAAQRLAVHRNTLIYRFDKIAALTKRDPRRFEHAAELRLAMLLLSISDKS